MIALAGLRGVLAALGMTALAVAQNGDDEHASHHPGQATDTATQPEQAEAGAQPMASEVDMGTDARGGMGSGMGKGMGKAVPSEETEFVPMLMNLGDLTPERAAQIQTLARSRAGAGITHMSGALDQMLTAFERDDLVEVEASAARMRDGLSQFESGIAAARALAERRSPQNSALQWLRRELDLVPPPVPHKGLLWGFSGIHLFFMALTTSVALGGLVLYSRRTQRASRLLEELVAQGASEPSPAAKAAQPDTGELSRGLIPVERRKQCKMRVCRIFQETPDVKTFRLVACDRGRIGFSYLPGQFLTLSLPIGGEKPLRRSYTISSSPTQAFYCEITVKREDQGVGSRYLHDELEEGATLGVQAPSGKFVFTGKEAESIVLIAGGVGITPMMSITRALTDMGWPGDIYFIAAVRDPEHWIFRDELRSLERRHPNLHLCVAASRLQEDVEGFQRGRLSEELLASQVPELASRRIHICGAPPMMASTKELLAGLGVPSENIHLESFGSEFKQRAKAIERERAGSTAEQPSGVGVHFQASDKSTQFLPNETLLEASERVDVNIEHSCRIGMCGVCRVKLVSGDVEMESEEGLEQGDEQAGLILACVARCSADIVVDA